MLSCSRSAARAYCTKSLVPMEKKSASFAKASAITATAGTSTMIPIFISGLWGAPSAASRALVSRASSLAESSSSMERTMGSRMRRSPEALARYRARSCVWNTSGWVRDRPRPLYPKAGLGPPGTGKDGMALSAPASKVRMMTGLPAAWESASR